MKQLIFLSLIIITSSPSCQERSTATRSFHYKELQENFIDSLKAADIKLLFGTWTINDIAKAGGSLDDDNTVQLQIGHQLKFNNNFYSFNFLNNKIEIEKPNYSISYETENNPGRGYKATTLFHGYMNNRKSAIMLGINNGYYFEVINFQELSFFSNGYIYFLYKEY